MFEVLNAEDAEDLRRVDLDRLVNQFTNMRARDFNPSSLKEYDRRVKRAWELFSAWKSDPANFAPKTRTSAVKRAGKRVDRATPEKVGETALVNAPTSPTRSVDAFEQDGAYTSAFPIRRGHVVTISNLPSDLTIAEAERLAEFVKLLGSSG